MLKFWQSQRDSKKGSVRNMATSRRGLEQKKFIEIIDGKLDVLGVSRDDIEKRIEEVCTNW